MMWKWAGVGDAGTEETGSPKERERESWNREKRAVLLRRVLGDKQGLERTVDGIGWEKSDSRA